MKLKVLECIRQGEIGGGESHLLSLMEHIDQSAFVPVVLSFTNGPMVDRLAQMRIPCFVIPTKIPLDVTVWNRVKQLMKRESIQLVHVHGSRANTNVFWAARSLNIPMIYTIHGWSFHPDQHFFVRKLRETGEKFLTRWATKNISVSESNQLTGKKVIPHLDSVVINNGIDLKKFNPHNRFRDIRKELNIPESKILLLFLARFTGHKQPLALIRSFAQAYKLNDQLHLLMVGDGDQKPEADKMLKDAGLQHCVTLLPFRQDVPDILAAANIYILPSLWEGLPIGLLEAMAMGKPVIGTRVDGTSEIIEDNKNGLLIDTDFLEENLTEKILYLSQNHSLQKYLGEKAIETVTEKYSAAFMTREIEKQYKLVVNNIT